MHMLVPPLEHWPILMPLLIGLMAGVCEETLFRGPIQTGLLRRMPKWTAIVITALLFAAAHLDLWGMPIRAFLGVVLGWMVFRTGSVFPAMLMHAAFDATQLLVMSRSIQSSGKPDAVEMHAWMLAAGAGLVIMGYLLLLRSRRPVTAPPPQQQTVPAQLAASS